MLNIIKYIKVKSKHKEFNKNEDFFKWINKNKEKVKNIRIFINQNNISVNYEKM